MPHISLIIINYNGAALLPGCIESALATCNSSCELIVVDNASTDDSLALLARYQPRVRVVRSPHNLGFGRACNLAVAVARGDLLVFLNPDVTLLPGWLEPLATAASTGEGLFCPLLLPPGTPPPPASERQLRETAALPGCGLTARRDVWLAIGGFDEAFFLYWEDSELCWRAWLLGWRVAWVRNSAIWHQKSAITRRYGRWDAERARNSLYTYLKLMRWRVVLPFMLRLLLVCCVKATLRPRLLPALLTAWRWNLRHLPRTLHQRAALARKCIGAYTTLEQRVRAQQRGVEYHSHET